MPLAGKLLLAFNLLAAAGLVYLASQDWARRQDLTAVDLQYHLVLAGLPVDAPDPADPDDIPFPVPTTGGQVIETVREDLVKAYLKGAEGGEKFGAAADKPVATQVREAKRVQDKLDAALRAVPAKERLDLLCGRGAKAVGLLVRLAESFVEREAVARLNVAADPQAVADNVEKAEAILKRKFDAVLAKPDPKAAAEYADRVKAADEKLRAAIDPRQQAETRWVRAMADKSDPQAAAKAEAERKAAEDALQAAYKEFLAVLADQSPAAAEDDADRRRRAAHLLVLLDPSADWQTRAAKVVGLKAYQRAVADQTAHLQDMARSVQRQIESDQASFVERYEQLRVLAYDRAGLAQEQEGISKTLAAILAHDTEDVNRRQAELTQLQETLAQVKAEVAAKLTAQAEVERQLFDVEKAVGETLRANFALEDKLDKAETAKAKN